MSSKNSQKLATRPSLEKVLKWELCLLFRFLIVQYTIGRAAHPILMSSLDHCICTAKMANIWADPCRSIELAYY